MDKSAWRARAKADRLNLVIDSAGHCRAIETFLSATVPAELMVVVFDAMPGEVDLSQLPADHADPSARYAVTRTPEEGFQLTVHPVGGPTEQHRYGYIQPTADAPQVADDRIGAVLVPALAFAANGDRLGRGMGYYDRFLARLGGSGRDVLFIGVTGGYVVESLPTDSYDVPMTHLATADSVVAVSG
ncbi:MAG: 5-formyltetrahydrofolate cyclo-ligase [Actinomycetota bacterium]